jgi:hypothetical protein
MSVRSSIASEPDADAEARDRAERQEDEVEAEEEEARRSGWCARLAAFDENWMKPWFGGRIRLQVCFRVNQTRRFPMFSFHVLCCCASSSH